MIVQTYSILIVDNSASLVNAIIGGLSSLKNCRFSKATTFSEVKAAFSKEKPDRVICNLVLPDAPHGEVLDFTTSQGVPTIVLSGSYDEFVASNSKHREVIDYVVKNALAIPTLKRLLVQLEKNRSKTILLVDDSKMFRSEQTRLLQSYNFNVIEAADGQQAWETFLSHPEIDMVITDLEMPKMNGIELIDKIREKYPREKLPIIGLSASGSSRTSAKFLKHGANDFIIKPFVQEEFNCRVQQNIDILEYINELDYAANRDFLTGLYNRKNFFQRGPAMVAAKQECCLAMLDVDHFKQVNDTYGHDIGDLVLKALCKLLDAHAPKGSLPARLGGEEFALLLPGLDVKVATEVVEKIRIAVEQLSVPIEGDRVVQFTLSAGVTDAKGQSLDEALKEADLKLYAAKSSGRNRVVV